MAVWKQVRFQIIELFMPNVCPSLFTMNQEKVRQIFDEAIDIESVADRESYIRNSCAGDEVLKARVDQLVAAFLDAGSFLESAPQITKAQSDGVGVDGIDGVNELFPGLRNRLGEMEGVGDQIGPYLLNTKLGEGGFGLVFAAQQQQPVKRDVAIKLIKPGMDSREVLARFNMERQTLAIMDHPAIATILDAGTTKLGRPYFVMELVGGTAITDFCDSHQLSTEQRLELFVRVCNGVQHAHQKGVIHRDLKPSNILVVDQDSKAAPKIIDFGIAKATDQSLFTDSLQTRRGQLVGTLMYMSPEQAASKHRLIDARSDIYSLGILLYELLTGSTPISRGDLEDTSFDRVMNKIQELDTPKPSSRLTERSLDLQTVAKNRNVNPSKLKSIIQGDLDWIVGKALDKDIERRYDSAGAFARDIERFLASDPIEARPPSVSYRAEKFIRKNKLAIAAATAIIAILLCATLSLIHI